jgi:hypothetical protein
MQAPVLLNIFASRTMKIVSVILIIVYLMLPVICFGHPCDMLSTNSQHSAIASDASGECPYNHGTDCCETTCCCAGHFPLYTFTEVPYAGLTAKQSPYEPHLALPQFTDRIFVPPQNHS